MCDVLKLCSKGSLECCIVQSLRDFGRVDAPRPVGVYLVWGLLNRGTVQGKVLSEVLPTRPISFTLEVLNLFVLGINKHQQANYC
jgi:hypothetical protein